MFKFIWNKETPKIIFMIIFLSWIINAFVNMYYTYFCSVISLPLLIVFVNKKFSNEGENYEQIENKEAN